MKKISIILSFLLLGLLMPAFISSPVNSSSEWSTPTQLTSNSAYDSNPSISYDGSKIAFHSDVDGDYEIFVINSDGTGLTQLTSNTADDKYPSISGDGQKIAFESSVDGDSDIWVVNSDGSDLTQLTINTLWEYQPQINGDGTRIAFQAGSGMQGNIIIINSDGSGGMMLTDNFAVDEYPSISYDGTKIAFVFDVDGTFGPEDSEIFVINSDGTGLAQVTSNTAGDWYPSISGDGSKIAFHSYFDGDNEICIVNSDGTGLTQLTSNTANDKYPSISGDGTKIAYQSLVDGDFEIYLISLESSSDGFELSAGWNMVSFPALPDDPSFSSIFSGVPFYQILTWDGSSYVTPTSAEAGVGYWVLVLEETTISIESASPVTSFELELPAGWSMIGSIYGETVDAGTVFPGFYQLLTWDGTSYVPSTTIEPGKGYWVLVLEPTTITVGG